MYQHHNPDTSYIQERLFDLQKRYPVLEGLLLVSYGGFVLASTFRKDDNVSRLAAVSRTMFLLAEDACMDMGRGEMKSVHLTYKRRQGGDDNAPSTVIMRPIGATTMLVMVLHSPLDVTNPTQEMIFLSDVERMVGFVAHMITQDANIT